MHVNKTAMLGGFIDEMEKISATVQELLEGVGRLGVTKSPRATSAKKILSDLMGMEMGWANPNPGVLEKLVSGGGAITSIPRNLKDAVRARHEDVFRAVGKKRGYSSAEVEDALQNLRNTPNAMFVSPNNRSYVLTGRGAANPGSLIGKSKGWRGESRKAFNVLASHHEGFERAALKGKNIDPAYAHMSPDVLMKEHNLLTRLTGPGSEEAKRTLLDTREVMGDAKALSDSLVERFGPKAKIEYGTSQKIPKAMRKAFLKDVPETWRSLQEWVIPTRSTT